MNKYTSDYKILYLDDDRLQFLEDKHRLLIYNFNINKKIVDEIRLYLKKDNISELEIFNNDIYNIRFNLYKYCSEGSFTIGFNKNRIDYKIFFDIRKPSLRNLFLSFYYDLIIVKEMVDLYVNYINHHLIYINNHIDNWIFNKIRSAQDDKN